jgi:putative ABC transport system permease protein
MPPSTRSTVLAAVSAGMFATRRVLDAPPSVTLREVQG